MSILEVKNIQKNFGSTEVLKNISFSMEEGTALSIIGSSGSGKTTLLRCLNFLETPDGGTIQVRGETLLMRDAMKRQVTRKSGRRGSTSAWCFSRSTCFRSIRHWRM